MNGHPITFRVKPPVSSNHPTTGFFARLEELVDKGHRLPWSVKPTPQLANPFGLLPAGVGLFDRSGNLVAICTDEFSADFWATRVNETFGSR
jgi:hypothetical protein